MKSARHAQILELISRNEIETQDDLVQRLKESGYRVTQATISRDIRELKLQKVPASKGGMKYAVGETGNWEDNKYRSLLSAALVSVKPAGNLMVVKTASGMAMAAAAALEKWDCEDIVGCIAGDDTIFCAMESEETVIHVIQKFEEMLRSR